MFNTHNLRRLLRRREVRPDHGGQSLVEYALMILFVAMAVVTMLSVYGGSLGALITQIVESLPF